MTEGAARDPLLAGLRDPASLLSLEDPNWPTLLVRARNGALLAKLACLLRGRGLLERVPEAARRQLEAAMVIGERNQVTLCFEADRIARTLAPLEVPVVLLKGSAYIVADLPAKAGRTAGDVDILVPRSALAAVEAALLSAGWKSAALSPYDERYYRTWMHEIPPLNHSKRDVVTDVHHSIAPMTARYQPDAEGLLAAAIPLGKSPLHVLCPADMVLHSAAHLLNEEMLGPTLRDLADLHDLLTDFGERPGYWDSLLDRAGRHGLERPLYYAVTLCHELLGTVVPPEMRARVQSLAPPGPINSLMLSAFSVALPPPSPGRIRPAATAARGLLYLRSHWLKMPPLLLARHLATKAWMNCRATFGAPRAKPEAH